MKISLRVLLADDTPVVRQHVKGLLEREGFEIVGEAADGHEAVKLAQALDPDVAILDLSMPQLSGVDAAREIKRLCPRTQLILQTVHPEGNQLASALRAGIRGYVAKTESAKELVRAIWDVSRGRVFVSPSASRMVVNQYLPNPATSLI